MKALDDISLRVQQARGTGIDKSIAIFRAAMPAIESARALGINHERIFEAVNKGGLICSLRYYYIMFYKASKNHKIKADESTRAETVAAKFDEMQTTQRLVSQEFNGDMQQLVQHMGD